MTDEFILLTSTIRRSTPKPRRMNRGRLLCATRFQLLTRAVLLIGLESDGDSILEQQTRHYARNRGGGYVDLGPAYLLSRAGSYPLVCGEELFSGGMAIRFGAIHLAAACG